MMQERNLREIDGSHRKANEELHRMLQKQTQFRERTDERVDACEKTWMRFINGCERSHSRSKNTSPSYYQSACSSRSRVPSH
jgi:hypothetical protein